MTVLIIGANGQLATHLSLILPDALQWDREILDWLNPHNARERIVALKPSYIVNATGYTAVDRAEEEQDVAWLVNTEGPRQLALAACDLNVPLIHFSTDFVFDGSSDDDYRDCDPVNPLNVYGSTKLAGEIAVRTHCAKHWIIRTSWVFSEFGNNFVKTILRLSADRDQLSVVNDQLGRPTYAGDLADLSLRLLKSKPGTLPWGTYHLSGGKACTWYQFAVQIVQQAVTLGLVEAAPDILPISSSEYPTKARRPLRTVMAGSAELDSVMEKTPNWEEGLEEILQGLIRAC